MRIVDAERWRNPARTWIEPVFMGPRGQPTSTRFWVSRTIGYSVVPARGCVLGEDGFAGWAGRLGRCCAHTGWVPGGRGAAIGRRSAVISGWRLLLSVS
jgi:hypothetical protein